MNDKKGTQMLATTQYSENLSHSWNVFASLERDLQKSFDYIEPSYSANRTTVSIHNEKILLTACAEIDNLLQQSASHWNIVPSKYFPSKSKNDRWNIKRYFALLKDKEIIADTKAQEIFVNNRLKGLLSDTSIIKPFREWTEEGPPFWWIAYNKLKHNRSAGFKEADVKNACHATAGLIGVLSILIDDFDSPSLELFGGSTLFHVKDMPREGASYTGRDGGSVIDGGNL